MKIKKYPLTSICKCCTKKITLRLTAEQIAKYIWWKNNRKESPLIQNILPELKPQERELMISQICDECFHEITKEMY